MVCDLHLFPTLLKTSNGSLKLTFTKTDKPINLGSFFPQRDSYISFISTALPLEVFQLLSVFFFSLSMLHWKYFFFIMALIYPQLFLDQNTHFTGLY